MLLTFLRQICSHLFFYELFTLESSCFILCTYPSILINATELLFNEVQESMLSVPLFLLITLPLICLSFSFFFFFLLLIKCVVRIAYGIMYGNSSVTSTVQLRITFTIFKASSHCKFITILQLVSTTRSVFSSVIFTY